MVALPVQAEEIENILVRRLSVHRSILGIFMRQRRKGYLEVWLVTEPLTHDEELAFHRVADEARDELPDVDINIHIEHTGMYEDTNPFDVVPSDARAFRFQTA